VPSRLIFGVMMDFRGVQARIEHGS
jgi:hypothetical protein